MDMTLRTRRFLFWGLLLLFFMAGTAIILYSEGWRFATNSCALHNLLHCELTFEKTGGIFLRTTPRGVTILMDGKSFEDQSGFIQQGTLIPNLSPKLYQVQIQKEGYFPWVKNIRVLPQLVTQALHIILIPKAISEEQVPISRLRGEHIEAISDTGKKIIIQDVKAKTYYMYDISNPAVAFNININFTNTAKANETIVRIIPHSFDQNKLIIETTKGLYNLDTLRLEIETIQKNQPITWTVQGSSVYYLKKSTSPSATTTYALYSWNMVLKNENQIFTFPDNTSSSRRFTGIEVSSAQNRVALLDNERAVYLIDLTQNTIKKATNAVSDFEFSPDGKKLALLTSGKKLQILFLDDSDVDNSKRKGDLIAFELIEQPLKVTWHKDSYHILIGYVTTLHFKEIDDRLPNNDYILREIPGSIFYYDKKSNAVYSVKNNALYRFSL